MKIEALSERDWSESRVRFCSYSTCNSCLLLVAWLVSMFIRISLSSQRWWWIQSCWILFCFVILYFRYSRFYACYKWLNLSPLGRGGTSQFLFPDHCPKWVKCPMSRQWLNLSPLERGGKRKVFPRLTLSPNETLFILVNSHVTWKFPFSSGVPIGYCLRDCLVIGWF